MQSLGQWYWARTNTKWGFVLWHGVIGWGGLSALLLSVWNYLSPDEVTIGHVALHWILFPLFGIVWGLTMWRLIGRKGRGTVPRSG